MFEWYYDDELIVFKFLGNQTRIWGVNIGGINNLNIKSNMKNQSVRCVDRIQFFYKIFGPLDVTEVLWINIIRKSGPEDFKISKFSEVYRGLLSS